MSNKLTMKTQIKVMPDGFVWRVLTPAEARALWQTNTFEIFHLDSDGSEHLIESDNDFNEAVDDCVLAIEVGFANEDKSLFNGDFFTDKSSLERRMSQLSHDFCQRHKTGLDTRIEVDTEVMHAGGEICFKINKIRIVTCTNFSPTKQ